MTEASTSSQLRAASPPRDSENNRNVDGTTQPCPLAKRHWIEIKLVDDDQNGIADEVLKVIDPEGVTHSGKTDQRGWARIEGLPQGTCRITFPNLDQEAWEFVSTESGGSS